MAEGPFSRPVAIDLGHLGNVQDRTRAPRSTTTTPRATAAASTTQASCTDVAGLRCTTNGAPSRTDNDISGTPAQQCPTAPDPEGPPLEEPDQVPTGGPSDVLLGTAIVVLLAGALALLAGRRRTA